LIQETYPAVVEQHENQITQLKSSPAKFKWDEVVSQYEQLLKINQEVTTLPVLIVKQTKEQIKFNIKDYNQNLTEAKSNAADVYYQEGNRLSKINELDV
jgi:hypothetical protein